MNDPQIAEAVAPPLGDPTDDTFEAAVVKVLDEILQALRVIQGLLTPNTVTVTTTPSQAQNGYQCGICKRWVTYGTSHYCTGYVAGST